MAMPAEGAPEAGREPPPRPVSRSFSEQVDPFAVEERITAALDQPPAGQSTGAPITDLESVSWYMRKLGQHVAEAMEVERYARMQADVINAELDAEIRKIEDVRARMLRPSQEWAEGEKNRIGWYIADIEAKLKEWMEAQTAEDPKLRTKKLVGGRIEARKQADEWEIEADEFIVWVEETMPDLADEYRKIEKKPIRTPIKKAFEVAEDADEEGFHLVTSAGGEAVPGIKVKVGGDEITVIPDVD